MITNDIKYDSGNIKKRPHKYRSFVGGNRGHYIFRIRGGVTERKDAPLMIEVHSSVSRNQIGRTGGWAQAATELHLSREDAHHLVAAVLGALHGEQE